MENSFEALIATYIENKVGISEHFLSTNLANNLKQNLIFLNQKSHKSCVLYFLYLQEK